MNISIFFIYVVNFVFTLCMYMFIPFLIVKFRKKSTSKRQIILFSVLNSIFVPVAITIVRYYLNDTKAASWMVATFWYFINYNFLEWKLIDNAVVKNSEDEKPQSSQPVPKPPAPPIAKAQPAPALEQDTYTKPIKSRYCKYCGGLLPQDSGKCLDCGKNNFRIIIPRPTTSSIIAVILAIGLTAVSVASYNQSVKIAELNSIIAEHEQTIAQTTKLISDMNANIIESKSRKDTLVERTRTANSLAEKYRKKANYLDYFIVFVAPTGEKYHRAGCQYLVGTNSFLAYDTDSAVAMGYTPCSVCH